ncbi:MAG: hypothetical protein ACXQS8_08185 [Candidatus Helarchaeales archaeon]
MGKFKRIKTAHNRRKVKCLNCSAVFYERYHYDTKTEIYYCPNCKENGRIEEKFILIASS